MDGNGTYKCYVEEVIVHPNLLYGSGFHLFKKNALQII